MKSSNYIRVVELTAAARSICPTPPARAAGAAPPFALGAGAAGLAAGLGGGGLTPGLGFAEIGGGTLAAELPGLEPSGVELVGVAAAFFQGVGPPLAPPIPGKTATGAADAFAVTGVYVCLGTDEVGRGREGGGGGGGAAAAGTGSR